MGTICPECGERSNVVGHITIDGLPPKTAEDVIASRLACGHVVGGEDYESLLETVREIDNEKEQRIGRAMRQARNAKTAAYKAYVAEMKKDDAE